MSKFVRQSKFRHVFGTVNKPEQCYLNVKLTRSAWDSNFVAVNPKFVAVCWESGGGGAFACIRHQDYGKLSPDLPVFAGHTGAVLDLDFNPFNDNIIASGSEDCHCKIWNIPNEGLKQRVSESVVTLKGHNKKVGFVNFNPTASNILATSSPDATARIWDIQTGQQKLVMEGHTDMIMSSGWNYDGSLFATTCKDKKLRIFDPRAQKVVQEANSHAGVKGSRLCWLGASNRLATVGFTKQSERQLHVWDGKNWAAPQKEETIDTSAGVIMPFWDDDCKILYLAGKGDGNIRYYEFVDEAPEVYFPITEFKSNVPQRGCAMLPKRSCDVNQNEVCRLYKLTTNAIEPISFRVPRKSDQFQEDLFPDCASDEAALTAEAWLSGQTAPPKKISMKGGFDPSQRKQAAFEPSAEAQATNVKEKELTLPEAKARIKELESMLNDANTKIRQLEAKAGPATPTAAAPAP